MPLSYQELIEEIFAHGGTFVRHGRSHDQYASASGEPIWVPRHRGDVPKGLERKVFSSSDWESRDLGGSNDVRI